MTLTANGAIDLLLENPSSYATADALLKLVREVSVESSGAVTVLYSGKISEGVWSTDVIDAMRAAGDDVRLIDKTEAAAFLQSDEFLGALGRTQGVSLAQMQDRDFRHPVKNWLFDAKIGPWADTSARFVEATVGEVRVLAPYADSTRVFAQTELPGLLRNPNITGIDGFPIAVIKAAGNEAEILNVIREVSREQVYFSRISEGNASTYLNWTDAASEAAHNDKNLALAYTEATRKLVGVSLENAQAGKKALQSILKTASAGAPYLKKLGMLVLPLTFALSVADANAHPDRAKEIMTEWAVDAGGSSALQWAAGAIAAVGAGALAAAGVIPASVAAAIVFGAALIGGFFGGDGAVEFYRLLKERDENGRRELFNKLDNLLFGVTSTITTPLPADLNGNKLTIDASLSRDDIVANAKGSMAWRYALRELNPFVVTDVDYARHNLDGSLNLMDEATGAGMSDHYLSDRAAMLTWKLRWDQPRALDDDDSPRMAHKSYDDDWDTAAVAGNWDFVDMAVSLPGRAPLTLAIDGTGISLSDHQIVFGSTGDDVINGAGDSDRLYGMAGNDTVSGKAGADYLEGGAGNDKLDGGADNDALYGGIGDDILTGGQGNDVLHGGAGADTYIVAANEGVDSITSSDATDVLKFAGRTLTGSGTLKTNANGVTVWVDESVASAPVIYMFDANRAELTLAGSGSTVVIKDFQSGDLGITAPVATPPVVPPAPPTSADFASVDGFQQYKDWSHAGQAASTFTNIAAGFYRVEGSKGSDVMTGGASLGSSATSPTSFNATQIVGRAGDDRLFAVAEQTEAQALAGTPLLTAQEAPLLDGGQGNDFIVGSSADDLVFGGQGDDRIITGAGRDIVLSDGDMGTGFKSFAELGQAETVMEGSNRNGLGGQSASWRDLGPVSAGEYAVYITSKGWTGNPAGAGNRLSLPYGYIDPLANIDLRAFAQDTLGTRVLPESNPLYAAVAAQLGYEPGSFDLVIQGSSRTSGNGGYAYDPNDPNPQTRLLDSFSTAAYAGRDVIDTGAGDDVVNAGGGDDIVFAGADNDVVAGYQGNDILNGDAGDDLLYGDYLSRLSTALVDGITGLSKGQTGLDGSQHGNDLLNGGGGNDVLMGNGGSDVLNGGDDNDELHGDEYGLSAQWSGNDVLDGGAGKDTLIGGALDDVLKGGTGDDVLFGDGEITYAAAEGHGNDDLDGGDGNDRLYGGGRDDVLVGGAGNDQLMGDDTIDKVPGTIHGNDQLDGGAGDDTLAGGGGNDVLNGGEGNDWLAGEDEEATNAVSTLTGNDLLDGGAGADTLVGGNGDDQLRGGEGDDLLFGGAGNDTLDGGAGIDGLSGGAGDDTYIVRASDLSDGAVVDTIVDNVGRNKIVIEGGEITAQAALNGTDLVLRIGAGGLVITNGMQGAVQTFQTSDGQELDLARALGRWLRGQQDLTASGAGQHLIGGVDNDVLRADADAQGAVLSGGMGNDTFEIASTQGTTLQFSQGDGRDTVSVAAQPRSADNVLRLAGDLFPEDLRLRREADTGAVVLDMASAGDALVLGQKGVSQLATVGRSFDRIEFEDGTVLTWDELLARGVLVESAGNGASLLGSNVYDVMVGNEGSRRIDAGAGDDKLLAGSGNETLVGGSGNDTYYFSEGFGTDTVDDMAGAGEETDRIEFDETLPVTDARFIRSGADLFVVFQGSSDQLTVKQFFTNAGRQQIAFADGTSYERGTVPAVGLQDLMTQGDDTLQVPGDGNVALDAMGGNDVIRSGAGNDTLAGGSGDDTLAGGNGDDVLEGGTGSDQLVGGAGSDTYVFHKGDGVDTLEDTSTTGTNRIVLADVQESELTLANVDGGFVLRYGSGDKITLSPQSFLGAIEFADGTVWSDWEIAAHLPVTVIGTSGNDQLNSNANSTSPQDIHGLGGNDTLAGGYGNDSLYGDEGRDWLYGGSGNGNDLLDGGDDADSLQGGGGNDVLDGGSGDDELSGGDGDDTLHGGSGNDRLSGDGGADVLHGDDGNDILEATANADGRSSALYGDAGDDRLVGSNGSERLEGGDGNDNLRNLGWGDAVDTIVGGQGDDTFSLESTRSADFVFTQGDGHDTFRRTQYVADGAAATGTLRVKFAEGVAASSLKLVGLTALPEADGDAANMALTFTYGTHGDTISYALDGRAIRPNMVNSLPNFVFADGTVRSASSLMPASMADLPVIGSAAGEVLFSTGTWTATDGGAVLGISNRLTGGKGDDTLIGLEGNNTYHFDRGDGKDLIYDYGGTDAIEFGAGITPENLKLSAVTYYNFDYASDRILEVDQGGGQIRISSSVDNQDYRPRSGYADVGKFESFRFADGTVLDWTQLVARAGSFTVLPDLNGRVLVGTEFNDRLEGGVGEQTLQGGAGVDTYVFKRGDAVVAEAGDISGADLILDTSIGNIIEFGPGIAAGDLRFRRFGPKLLIDVLGGAAPETIGVDYFDDPRRLSSFRFADGSTLDVSQGIRIALAGTDGDDVMNGTANSDYFDGGLGNDQINGKAGNDWLLGGAGNDKLDGGAGVDDMAGGTGDDTYIVDDSGDTITENAGEGLDSVQSTASYILSSNVENLTLTGSSGLSGTGNAASNKITGNSGANRLDGKDGVDTLIGGAGNDTYVVDDTSDLITEASGAGTDTVEASVNYTLLDNIEALTLTGSGNITATGNGAANTLTGNAGNNVLDGKGGLDTMTGGLGDDSYFVDTANEVTQELDGQGIDTVNSTITWTLGNFIENLNLINSGAINGTGNALDNLLFGNAGVNTLKGEGGNDTYSSGAGNDVMNDTSNSSNDVYRWGRGDGQDTITDAGGSDRVEIATGITAAQLTQTRSGNNLVLGISGVTADKLTITNYYVGTANKIETIKLADGTGVPITAALAGTAAPTEKAMPATTAAVASGNLMASGTRHFALVSPWDAMHAETALGERRPQALPTLIPGQDTGLHDDAGVAALTATPGQALWRGTEPRRALL
jgi:Ca2+-binding RTX toxin-like protein